MRYSRMMKGIVVFVLLMGLAPLRCAARQQAGEPRHPAPGGGGELPEEIRALIARRQFDRAERLLDHLLLSGSDPAAAYFQFGKIYFDNQQWDRSARFFEKSLQLEKSNDQAHLLLGLAWRELKRPEEAEAEFIEAAKENPSSDVNAYFAGHQLLLETKFEAALPYLYRSIALNPHRSEAFRALAMAQAYAGNYGLAESYYRKALAVAAGSGDRDYADTLDLGFLLLLGHDRTRLDEGLKIAQRAVELRPDAADAHYLLGKALFKLGRAQEAIPELEHSARLNPQDSKPHFLMAQAFDQLGQPEKAGKEREALAWTQRQSARSGIATGKPLPTPPE